MYPDSTKMTLTPSMGPKRTTSKARGSAPLRVRFVASDLSIPSTSLSSTPTFPLSISSSTSSRNPSPSDTLNVAGAPNGHKRPSRTEELMQGSENAYVVWSSRESSFAPTIWVAEDGRGGKVEVGGAGRDVGAVGASGREGVEEVSAGIVAANDLDGIADQFSAENVKASTEDPSVSQTAAETTHVSHTDVLSQPKSNVEDTDEAGYMREKEQDTVLMADPDAVPGECSTGRAPFVPVASSGTNSSNRTEPLPSIDTNIVHGASEQASTVVIDGSASQVPVAQRRSSARLQSRRDIRGNERDENAAPEPSNHPLGTGVDKRTIGRDTKKQKARRHAKDKSAQNVKGRQPLSPKRGREVQEDAAAEAQEENGTEEGARKKRDKRRKINEDTETQVRYDASAGGNHSRPSQAENGLPSTDAPKAAGAKQAQVIAANCAVDEVPSSSTSQYIPVPDAQTSVPYFAVSVPEQGQNTAESFWRHEREPSLREASLRTTRALNPVIVQYARQPAMQASVPSAFQHFSFKGVGPAVPAAPHSAMPPALRAVGSPSLNPDIHPTLRSVAIPAPYPPIGYRFTHPHSIQQGTNTPPIPHSTSGSPYALTPAQSPEISERIVRSISDVRYNPIARPRNIEHAHIRDAHTEAHLRGSMIRRHNSAEVLASIRGQYASLAMDSSPPDFRVGSAPLNAHFQQNVLGSANSVMGGWREEPRPVGRSRLYRVNVPVDSLQSQGTGGAGLITGSAIDMVRSPREVMPVRIQMPQRGDPTRPADVSPQHDRRVPIPSSIHARPHTEKAVQPHPAPTSSLPNFSYSPSSMAPAFLAGPLSTRPHNGTSTAHCPPRFSPVSAVFPPFPPQHALPMQMLPPPPFVMPMHMPMSISASGPVPMPAMKPPHASQMAPPLFHPLAGMMRTRTARRDEVGVAQHEAWSTMFAQTTAGVGQRRPQRRRGVLKKYLKEVGGEETEDEETEDEAGVVDGTPRGDDTESEDGDGGDCAGGAENGGGLGEPDREGGGGGGGRCQQDRADEHDQSHEGTKGAANGEHDPAQDDPGSNVDPGEETMRDDEMRTERDEQTPRTPAVPCPSPTGGDDEDMHGQQGETYDQTDDIIEIDQSEWTGRKVFARPTRVVEQLYQCPLCPRNFMLPNGLAIHLKWHWGKTKLDWKRGISKNSKVVARAREEAEARRMAREEWERQQAKAAVGRDVMEGDRAATAATALFASSSSLADFPMTPRIPVSTTSDAFTMPVIPLSTPRSSGGLAFSLFSSPAASTAGAFFPPVQAGAFSFGVGEHLRALSHGSVAQGAQCSPRFDCGGRGEHEREPSWSERLFGTVDEDDGVVYEEE